jgi:hypothetical protein
MNLTAKITIAIGAGEHDRDRSDQTGDRGAAAAKNRRRSRRHVVLMWR